jgi:hypothetical protein
VKNILHQFYSFLVCVGFSRSSWHFGLKHPHSNSLLAFVTLSFAVILSKVIVSYILTFRFLVRHGEIQGITVGDYQVFSKFNLNFIPSWRSFGTVINQLTPWRQNPKVHHRIHNSPPTVPILSQLNPLHTPPQPISLRSILTPSSHLRLGLPSGLFRGCHYRFQIAWYVFRASVGCRYPVIFLKLRACDVSLERTLICERRDMTTARFCLTIWAAWTRACQLEFISCFFICPAVTRRLCS